MLIVISPAKKLDMESEASNLSKPSQPLFKKQSDVLAKQLKRFKVKDFKDLMGVSDAIAELNQSRYQEWTPSFTQKDAKPAVLAFKGDVYQGLMPENFDAEDFEFAQTHLRILSGLYGCLRPKDLMKAYRLEMGVPLKNPKGKNLYEYWQATVTDHLKQSLANGESEFLVNLASNEYFKAVDKKSLGVPVITPVFKDYKNGQYKVISFLAKKARGMMCAHLIKSRAQSVEDIQKFSQAGYKFSKKDSTSSEIVFLRKENK